MSDLENPQENPIPKKGKLYVVSTPIGNFDDISLRALKVMRECDLVVAEEPKEGAKLLHKYNINKKLEFLNEQNEYSKSQELLQMLQEGSDLALISDCGTPVFADPGYMLVKSAINDGINVIVVPGVSSIMTAVVRSTFDINQFIFAGFLSRDKDLRIVQLNRLKDEFRTIVLLETPYRLLPFLEAASLVMPDRHVYIGCNLTMPYESHHYGTFTSLYEKFAENKFKGEFVIVFEGQMGNTEESEIFTAKEAVNMADLSNLESIIKLKSKTYSGRDDRRGGERRFERRDDRGGRDGGERRFERRDDRGEGGFRRERSGDDRRGSRDGGFRRSNDDNRGNRSEGFRRDDRGEGGFRRERSGDGGFRRSDDRGPRKEFGDRNKFGGDRGGFTPLKRKRPDEIIDGEVFTEQFNIESKKGYAPKKSFVKRDDRNGGSRSSDRGGRDSKREGGFNRSSDRGGRDSSREGGFNRSSDRGGRDSKREGGFNRSSDRGGRDSKREGGFNRSSDRGGRDSKRGGSSKFGGRSSGRR